MVKQRPKYKPLQVLLASIDGLDALRLDLPVPLNRLAAMFMPGAFSPIAEARDNCSLATIRRDPATGKTTQGVRIPNSAATLRILRAVGPLAATSANRSGEESAQTVDRSQQHLQRLVFRSLLDHVDFPDGLDVAWVAGDAIHRIRRNHDQSAVTYDFDGLGQGFVRNCANLAHDTSLIALSTSLL